MISMQYGGITVLNRSCLPIAYEERSFFEPYRASCENYTQHYQNNHSLHYHNVLEIGRCLNGSGVQFVHKDIYPFSVNSISVIQKGCIHDSHIIMTKPTDVPSNWQYIFVDMDALGLRSELTESFNTYSGELTALFEMMFRELSDKPEGYRRLFELLLTAFLVKVKRLEPTLRPIQHSSMADQIASVLNFIAQTYTTDITIEQLAQEFNLSVSYFRKIFQDNLGVSPQQYIIHLRLSMAEQLLRTTQKQILEISEEVGFRSLSSFNRLFKKAYGCSPRSIR